MACSLCSGSIMAAQKPSRKVQQGSEFLKVQPKQKSSNKDTMPSIVEARCAAGCRRFFHFSCFEKALNRQNTKPTTNKPDRCDKQSNNCNPTTAAWGKRQFWLSLKCFPQTTCHANITSVCLFSLTPTRRDSAALNMVKVSAAICRHSNLPSYVFFYISVYCTCITPFAFAVVAHPPN